MTHAEIQKLALDSGVPFTTLWKIRMGETQNPGFETVRLFVDHLPVKAPSKGAKPVGDSDHAKAAKKVPREKDADRRDRNQRRSDKPNHREGR